MDSSAATVRPTKKQRDILTYIEQFIAEHGYSPSYREIMNGLNYTSVATVALHVNSLIRRGHLRKRDRSARSLEVVASSQSNWTAAEAVRPNDEKWLIAKVDSMFDAAFVGLTQGTSAAEPASSATVDAASKAAVDDLAVMVQALRILGLTAAATSFGPRLSELSQTNNPVSQPTADPAGQA